jgi:L-lactate permease
LLSLLASILVAVIIAFSFGALLEALAGFGTPEAITATMLVAFGFKPMKAASVALVANTAPVAFGAIAIPIVTLAGLTEIPKEDLGAMVGRQTPLLALFVPLILVGMVDGWRGVKPVWPAALVGGVSFAIGQFACSNYLSVELTDIVASLLSVAAMVAFLRVWQPGTPLVAERHTARGGPIIAGAATADAAHEAAIRRREGHGKDSRGDILGAYAPYLIIIVVFGLAQWGPIKDLVAKGSTEFAWPGLDILNAKGEAPSAVTYKLNWLPAAGTLLLICGLLTMAFLRISPRRRRARVRAHAQPAQVGDADRRRRARPRLRDEPERADADDRQLDRRRRRRPGVPVADHRLARHGRDRLGHLLELALRCPPGVRGQGGRAGPDPAGERELVGRRAGQDGLAAEPGDRSGRRRPRRRGGRPVQEGDRLEPPAAADHVHPGLSAGRHQHLGGPRDGSGIE